MKPRCQRKLVRLSIEIEHLLLLLDRDGHFKKEIVLKDKDFDAVPGPTVLPDDARLASASVDLSGRFLDIYIEADSFGDSLLRHQSVSGTIYLPKISNGADT
jgi:hypothetical protein